MEDLVKSGLSLFFDGFSNLMEANLAMRGLVLFGSVSCFLGAAYLRNPYRFRAIADPAIGIGRMWRSRVV
jgi:hypothetical protein